MLRHAVDAAAAHSAGLKTCLVLRPGAPGGEAEGADAPTHAAAHSIKSLAELFPHAEGGSGEDASPHKKRRSGGASHGHAHAGGEEGEGGATKVCVETGAEHGEHHAAGN